MLKLYPRKAHVICCIIIGSLIQTQGFSTTVVKEGEEATIECGLQTKVEEGYLKWEAITNDTTVVLAFDVRDGNTDCDDRITNCTLHTNGSIQLESVSKEDGARYYRCLRGDDKGYHYYSDHRLLVWSKGQMSSPPSIETPHRGSVSSYNMGKKGVLHGYNAPVCEDDADGILPVVCYPPPGIIVDREYETIQCNCTDSDGQVDSVTFPVTNLTHWVHPGWKTANISLLVILILIILVLICCYLYMKLKKSKAYHPETSFKVQTYTSQDHSDYDGGNVYEKDHPILDSNDQDVVLTKRPAGDTKETTQVARTVSLWDAKTVKPHADNGPKRPCIEYRILDESKGERSFCFQFELKKPGVHLVLSTRREENSPSKYEIYFDEGKIRTSTKGKEGESFLCGCGKFSMIMEGEELSLSILDEDEGWIPLHTWEEQVYLNQCCSIAVFNMKFLQVEKCRRLTEFENPTSRTLSLHPKRE